MINNELIKREYTIAIQKFEKELERIDIKYKTFAKIDVDFEQVYQINRTYPAHYFRTIKLEEVIIK